MYLLMATVDSDSEVTRFLSDGHWLVEEPPFDGARNPGRLGAAWREMMGTHLGARVRVAGWHVPARDGSHIGVVVDTIHAPEKVSATLAAIGRKHGAAARSILDPSAAQTRMTYAGVPRPIDLSKFDFSETIFDHPESADTPVEWWPPLPPGAKPVPEGYVVTKDIHAVPVYDTGGKLMHTIRRCRECGVIYGEPPDDPDVHCPTCGCETARYEPSREAG
jgi:hypothetical protein